MMYLNFWIHFWYLRNNIFCTRLTYQSAALALRLLCGYNVSTRELDPLVPQLPHFTTLAYVSTVRIDLQAMFPSLVIAAAEMSVTKWWQFEMCLKVCKVSIARLSGLKDFLEVEAAGSIVIRTLRHCKMLNPSSSIAFVYELQSQLAHSIELYTT